MKHTPGPWEYDGKFSIGIPHKDGWTGFLTNPEDARLIAAAPEMLEALKAAQFAFGFGSSATPQQRQDAAEAITAAIAKAEGNSS
jgi:hypothetical protein